jgi:hypothetical protein
MILSYRASLTKIGIPKTASVSYRGFFSRPESLQEAIASMDAPTTQQWSQVSDIFRDDDWTDEVQGVAWDGSHWIFSANANQAKPGHNDKAIYVFKGGESLGDGKWVSMLRYKDVPHPVSGTTESDDHWGQLCYFKGSVYVAHFWAGGPKHSTNVVVFKDTNGMLEFSKWIELEEPKSPTDGRQERVEVQAINPWDGMFYTCFGSGDIYEFFIHDRNSGKWTGKTIKFDTPVTQVQGACFSPSGHLYIATNAKLPSDSKYQTIWYYSALNGHRFGVIPVLAEEDDQELEGICFGSVTASGGQGAQIHAVLLENRNAALDNIFFKSFASAVPAVV